MTRLQELGYTDFTGGLNVRNQRSFQVADNESPEMLNMVADQRLGIYTRRGFRRWNATPVGATPIGQFDFVLYGNANNAGICTLWANTLYINNLTSGEEDISSILEQIGPGAVITVGGKLEYTVTSATDNSTHYQFEGSFTGGLAEGPVDVWFSDAPTVWNPRNIFEHDFSDDTNAVFVTSDQGVFVAEGVDRFDAARIANCNATPHLADFASWGDSVYIACGRNVATIDGLGGGRRYDKGVGVQFLEVLGFDTFNNDYTTPDAETPAMPRSDYVEPHAGYLFCASIREDQTNAGERDYPNRIRWSHPSAPEAWAEADYLDIEVGGGRITGLMSFQDHLLIFKSDSVWGLYGYDSESWQLIKISRSIGVPTPTAVARSPLGVFMYSASGRGDIYLYNGQSEPLRISENIEEVLDSLPSGRAATDVWCAWADDVFSISLPYVADWDPSGGDSATHSSMFLWDPYVNNGSWRMYRPALGSVGPISTRADTFSQPALGVLYGDDVPAILIEFNAIENAADIIVDTVTETPFRTKYATNWKFAGHPELRKHWHRPRYIIRNPNQTFTLLFEIFRDYDETEPRRVHQLTINGSGLYFWRDLGADDPRGDGFDWEPTSPGRGGRWASSTKGGSIVRGKSFGIARSVQVVISTAPATPGKPWGIDAVVLKAINRRFTT